MLSYRTTLNSCLVQPSTPYSDSHARDRHAHAINSHGVIRPPNVGLQQPEGNGIKNICGENRRKTKDLNHKNYKYQPNVTLRRCTQKCRYLT